VGQAHALEQQQQGVQAQKNVMKSTLQGGLRGVNSPYACRLDARRNSATRALTSFRTSEAGRDVSAPNRMVPLDVL
jgi:hypothetical protein